MNGKADAGPADRQVPGLRVPLEGRLGLRNARQICDGLQEAIAKSDLVEIDPSGLEDIDVSIVQIVLAARRSAEHRGKTLALSVALPEPVRDVLVAVGLLGHGGVPRSPFEAFWLGKTPSQSQAAR